MKLSIYFLVFLVFISFKISHSAKGKEQFNDDDFSEFEEFDDEEEVTVKPQTKPSHTQNENNKQVKEEEIENQQTIYRKLDDDDDEDEVIVEEDDDNDEFSYFADEEEFIGYDSEKVQGGSKTPRSQEEPKITIAKVPLHLRSNWDSFYLEMLMAAGLVVYFLNFVFGKGKNQKLATAWFEKHRALLESNFALVGDDGKPEIENPGLRKESENVYILWCSGRTLMEGMLIELRLLKRQDLVAVIGQILRPSTDQLIIKVNLDEMDNFVFACGTKKAAGKLAKEMTDITTYCPEKKSGDKFGLGAQFVVHSELSEVAAAILRDHKVMAVINKNPELFEFFHFSDQYSGPKQQEEAQPTKLPQVKSTLVFGYNFPKDSLVSDSLESMKPLMQLTLYLIDKLSHLRLSKDAKSKAEKNRSKVEEAFLKATHAARAEMAQSLREEKKRKERERIMSLDDPEKQRKWEEKEQKRQMKRRAPKMKTLKIKPM
ncbi:Coiled-coil domain-containing protein 47 [Armadillidium nasatum]|uniref:PAT complex subunit CCDC47 n=1 Tax=Armadillidium nasatum TaxID=96803 RepID=A0A5N5TJV4_9CRUS|nr:Coiled-coil domain-containing protein 47 [Armadillidium nasatum]